MANSVAANPFVIDTVTDTAISNDTFMVHMIRYVSGSLADSISVQDEDGNVRWITKGDIANYSEESNFQNNPIFFNGLKVPTLDSGTLYLYVKRNY